MCLDYYMSGELWFDELFVWSIVIKNVLMKNYGSMNCVFGLLYVWGIVVR